MKISCIYKIENTETGHKYVGSTIHFDRRKARHLLFLNRGNHHSRYLQNAWNFYGKNKFEFSIIEHIDDVSKLIEREDYYAKLWKPEYNTMKDIKSHIGVKRSLETRKKMSLAQTGKTHSEATKEKIRQLTTGIKQSKKTIEKRIDSMKNSSLYQSVVKSKERNEKIKISRMKNGGYIVTDEQKRKISETLKSKNLQSAISVTIQKLDLDGNIICVYPSFIKAERDNGFWKGALSQNISRLKKEIYKGFRWKKLENQ